MTRHGPVRKHGRLAEEQMPAIGKQLLVRGVPVAEQLFDRLPCSEVHIQYAPLRNHGYRIRHRHHTLGTASLVCLGGEGPQFRAEFRVHCVPTHTHTHNQRLEGKLMKLSFLPARNRFKWHPLPLLSGSKIDLCGWIENIFNQDVHNG